MPPVTPVPHSRKRKPTLATQMLSAAAPSCTLQIPSKLEEGEVWERIRQAHPRPGFWYSSWCRRKCVLARRAATLSSHTASCTIVAMHMCIQKLQFDFP